MADGNMILDKSGTRALVLGVRDELKDPTQDRFVAHFVTCPDAREHRKPRR